MKHPEGEPEFAYRLQRLKLLNFGPLADTEFVFTWRPDRPLCLIEGYNGYGKTKIIEAFRFALHGLARRDDPVALLHRDAEKPRARLEVVLEMETSAGESARLRRSIEFAMVLGEWKVERQAFVAKIGDRALQDDEAQEWVDARLPKHVMECFVFDAENSPLAGLSAGADGAGVAEHLERVLGVSLLRTVRRRINSAAMEMRAELDRVADLKSVRQAKAALEDVDASLEKVEEDILDVTSQVSLLGEEKTRIGAELNKLLTRFDPTADEARAQRLSRREGLREKEEALRRELMESVGTSLPLQLLHEHIEFALERSQAARRCEEASAFSRGVEHAVHTIAHLAAEGVIPWGEDPIPPAVSIRETLASALELDGDGDESGDYLIPDSVAAQLRAALLEAHGVPVPSRLVEELQCIRMEFAGDEGHSETTRTGEVASDLRERHAQFLAERSDLEVRLSRRQLYLDELRGRRDALRQERNARVGDLKRARNDEKKQKQLRTEWEFTRNTAACLSALTERLRGLRVDDLERGASEMFRRTTNKPDLYAGVEFDRETLRYHIRDHDGRPAPFDRSTGERTILTLALVHGLRMASGRSLPLVVEAPFKPLDPVHTERVILHAFKPEFGYAILLLRPEEIPSVHRGTMASRAGQRFVLDRPDPRREITVVCERGE
ncbi:MAG: AAA family ATPase [Pseudomonadota bacterium]